MHVPLFQTTDISPWVKQQGGIVDVEVSSGEAEVKVHGVVEEDGGEDEGGEEEVKVKTTMTKVVVEVSKHRASWID